MRSYESRQAILPDALRVNANLFQTDLCRNPEAKACPERSRKGWQALITYLWPGYTGSPCRYDAVTFCVDIYAF